MNKAKFIKGLNQSLSATSRNLLVDAGEKNAINAKAIQRYRASIFNFFLIKKYQLCIDFKDD